LPELREKLKSIESRLAEMESRLAGGERFSGQEEK